METLHPFELFGSQTLLLVTHFPVWREWKHFPIECYRVYVCVLATHFPVWREWKLYDTVDIILIPCLLHTFPFEGNGNEPYYRPSPSDVQLLATHFPVWREWKLIPSSESSVMTLLATHFPVWREWKLLMSSFTENVIRAFLATHFPVWREWKPLGSILQNAKNTTTCYILSRLKGIETFTPPHTSDDLARSCYILSRLKGIETRLSDEACRPFFPCYILSRLKGIETLSVCCGESFFFLATYFPVWRELKHKPKSPKPSPA